jgi:hypothetical protein
LRKAFFVCTEEGKRKSPPYVLCSQSGTVNERKGTPNNVLGI